MQHKIWERVPSGLKSSSYHSHIWSSDILH